MSRSTFGGAKDDCLDSGTGRGGNLRIWGCIFERCFHEGIALSNNDVAPLTQKFRPKIASKAAEVLSADEAAASLDPKRQSDGESITAVTATDDAGGNDGQKHRAAVEVDELGVKLVHIAETIGDTFIAIVTYYESSVLNLKIFE